MSEEAGKLQQVQDKSLELMRIFEGDTLEMCGKVEDACVKLEEFKSHF